MGTQVTKLPTKIDPKDKSTYPKEGEHVLVYGMHKIIPALAINGPRELRWGEGWWTGSVFKSAIRVKALYCPMVMQTAIKSATHWYPFPPTPCP